MDTIRDVKRQRICPEEPRAAFAFHCARRDELLNEFNAVMAKQAAATDRESKRAFSAHMKEIMVCVAISMYRFHSHLFALLLLYRLLLPVCGALVC